MISVWILLLSASAATAQQTGTWYTPVAGVAYPLNSIPVDVLLAWGPNDAPAVPPVVFQLLKQRPGQVGFSDITAFSQSDPAQILHNPDRIRNTGTVATTAQRIAGDPAGTKYFVRAIYQDSLGVTWFNDRPVLLQ